MPSSLGNNIIVLNSSHATSNKSVFFYPFIQGSYTITEGSIISVREVTIPYSWFNISQTFYNNNVFSYTWVDGTIYTVTLLDGFYTTQDINHALENSFLDNGLYLIDAGGQNVYYIQVYTDITLYANQFLFYVVPLSLPVGFTAPATLNPNFYSVGTPITPQINISSTNTFGSILGFSAGSYPSPASTVDVGVLSNIIPNATPVNSIIMRCNLVSNNISFPTDILDSFTFQNVSFGANGLFEPKFPADISLKAGKYNGLSIEFVDQNFNSIPIRDVNVTITLLININKPDLPTRDSVQQSNLFRNNHF